MTLLWTIPGLVQAPPQHVVRSCAAQAAAGARNRRAQVVRGQEAQDATQQLRRHVLERAAHGAAQLRRSMHAAALGGRSTVLLHKEQRGYDNWKGVYSAEEGPLQLHTLSSPAPGQLWRQEGTAQGKHAHGF